MKKIHINTKSNSNYRKINTASWDVQGLEDYFNEKELPNDISLNAWTKINNVKGFISKHLEFAKVNNGNELFHPYFNRLTELKQVLSINNF